VDDPGVDPDAEHEGKKPIRAVSSATPTGALPRFLDQRFDKSFELITIGGLARSWRTRRCGDTHVCTTTIVELL
jgi:hypothetical protein